MHELFALVDLLAREHALTVSEYRSLLEGETEDLRAYAARRAAAARERVYGRDVYIRGLIEIGNVCRNDCFYCGIRRSNRACERYTLADDEILTCCREGYALGFRTFVLQSGEGAVSTDRICTLVERIKDAFPDCAVTLSLGEYAYEDYRRMYRAGADRYLLRHETADRTHYERLHPPEMSYDNRIRCLEDLQAIGFQTGCGFMVGSPYQTAETLAQDLKFVESFAPAMCGIGPFIPQKDTPFRNCAAGTANQTLFLLSLVRLIDPHILLPATTALDTVATDGWRRGLKAGANVVMPNLSPASARTKYALYDNKRCDGAESAQAIRNLAQSVSEIGYRIVSSRGDRI